MELRSFGYTEFEDHPRRWVLKPITFRHIKLLVGRNATGKTRTLNVINGLASVLSGPLQRQLASGTYDACFEGSEGECRYQIAFLNGLITQEHYLINGDRYLRRDRDGRTLMKASKTETGELEFKVPVDQVAAFVRRDEFQHPYLDELFQWATSVRHYRMGIELGRTHFFIPNSAASETRLTRETLPRPFETGQMLQLGLEKFGDRFKELVLSDMKAFDYRCTDVGLLSLEPSEFRGSPIPPIVLFVQEHDLECPTRQHEMSDGMFSALAMSVHINYLMLAKHPSCFLIDDIGENLDFDRSRLIVNRLIEKASKSPIQVIMTTNNRFIMNATPLEHWSILERDGHEVSEFSAETQPDIFKEFRFTGLSNFDLLSSGAYKEPAHTKVKKKKPVKTKKTKKTR